MTTDTSAIADEGDGRSRRWDAHRAERRADLCRAARRAVHKRGPDLSMDEIAAAMGTSKSIVYRYFTDKSGLQAAVGQDVLDEIADALEAAARASGTAQERVRAMVEVYVGTLTHSPNVYRFVTAAPQGALLSTFLATVTAAVAEPLREILADLGDDDARADLWAAGMVGFVRGAGDRWLQTAPSDRLGAAEMVDLIAGWLWRGATTRSRIIAKGDPS